MYVRVCLCRQLWVQGCSCFCVCQFHFAWLSMSSNALLCYWFLCEYLCIPCFCIIKWQSALSCQMDTIYSMCVGACTKTCEHLCQVTDTSILIYTYTTSFSTDWPGSFSSQHQLQYFALLLKLKDKHSVEFLALFDQWCSELHGSNLFHPSCRHEMRWVLFYVHRNHRLIRDRSPGWPPRLSQFLSSVMVKLEVFTTTSTREIQLCAQPATQLSRSPHFQQIAYTSQLSMCKDISERGLFTKCGE